MSQSLYWIQIVTKNIGEAGSSFYLQRFQPGEKHQKLNIFI